MAESFGNLARSHSQRSVNFAKGEARYCRCGAELVKWQRSLCDLCRLMSKAQKGPGCWLFTGATFNPAGGGFRYGQFYYQGEPRRAHIVSWLLHNGEIPDGLCVCHRCDVPLCVRPDHLFLGTQRENIQDASNKGRLNVARPGRQKVSAEDIEAMRRRVAAGETHKAVASDFGIARNTLGEIMQGKRRQYDAPIVAAVEKAS